MIYKVGVELQFDIYVESDSPDRASILARAAIRDEATNYTSRDYYVHKPAIVHEAELVEEEWIDSLPYGGTGLKTVRELLKNGATE